MTHLPHRGILEIQGEDKASFLQGLITQDIQHVTLEKAAYATLLSPQGRFLFDFFIMEQGDSYFLETEASRLDDLLKKLSLYKLRSRVTLTLRPDLKVYALWGQSLASSLGLVEERGVVQENLFMDPRLLELGARSIGPVENTSFQSASPEEYDLHRLVLGVPEGGRDLIPDKSILLESGLDELNAISWTKGCYLGQELTARTKYRGLVRKRLFPVHIEGEIPPKEADLFLNDQPAGKMMTHQGNQGLALLRLDAFKAYENKEGRLTWEESQLQPYAPFWMRLAEPS